MILSLIFSDRLRTQDASWVNFLTKNKGNKCSNGNGGGEENKEQNGRQRDASSHTNRVRVMVKSLVGLGFRRNLQ